MSGSAPLPRLSAVALLGVLAAPYLLNDFANILVHAPVPWLACDYGSRVVSLACVAWLVRRGTVAWSELALRGAAWWRFVLATLVTTAGGLALSSPAAREFFSHLTRTQPGFIPFIEPPWLHRVDYWGGIALVAVSEEVVFRGAFPALLARVGAGPWAALLVSSAMFGLAHWSLGTGAIVQTALIGAVFAVGARWGRSLWPVIVAHYIVDLVVFR